MRCASSLSTFAIPISTFSVGGALRSFAKKIIEIAVNHAMFMSLSERIGQLQQ